VGRLHRTSSRLDPSLLAEGYAYAGGGVANRSERFFYDGTRRIQELITDPVVVNNEDGDVATMGEENEQRGGGGGGGGGGAGQQPGPVTTILYLKAQYVWGPGDSPTAGVDELLLQQDTNGKQWYRLQDAQGDVVSLIHMPLGAGTTQAEVTGQWTYSPYGEVLTYEQFHPHPAITHGHKGLAIDRLDAPALSWDTATSSLSDTPRLMPGAKLLGYNRGRTTSFALGRFMQADPNASGLALQSSILFHGVATSTFEATVSVQTRLGDGLNLFGYLGSNPLTRYDPMGLSWDPFNDMVDDFLITNAASTAAFMGRISAGFSTTAYIAGQVAQLYPPIGAAVSIYNIATGQGSFMDILSVVPGGSFAKMLGKAASEATLLKGAYASGGLVGFAKKAPTPSGVWATGVGARGLAIETMLVPRLPGSKLPDGFKAFDKWDEASATAYSIKSLDLGAASYQNASAISSRIGKMASDAASFTYGRRNDVELLGSQIRSRVVVLGIPPGASREQLAAIREGVDRARSLKVQVQLVEVP
jgi:hypothetical protein